MFQVLLPSHESWVLPSIMMLARALEAKGVPLVESPLRKRPLRALAKVAGLMKVGRLPFPGRRQAAFFHINHPWIGGLYPYRSFRPCVTYSFDCWSPIYHEWERFFARTRPCLSFISAKASVAEMSKRCPSTEFRWLPEAIDPGIFHPGRPLADRQIDVLELGRRFQTYHEAIKGALKQAGRRHIYPKVGEIRFSYSECVDLYANTKVSLCFPTILTHPERAGRVETITFRYWEAIASKCLLVGHCPGELRELIGYNPVVEADINQPEQQLIEEILPQIDRYQALVDRNYDQLCQVWTVEHQAKAIVSALANIERSKGRQLGG
jgi:hypothetical protein